MDWTEKPIIFDDEDEEALIAQFVEFSALYPEHTALDVAKEVFKGKRDPFRFMQAAACWSADLGIKERLRLRKINGPPKANALTKEDLQSKILETVESTILTANEKKVRIDGYMAYARTEGWEIKAVDKKVDKTAKTNKTIVFAQYTDE